MSTNLRDTLLRVALPVLGIAVVLMLARVRQLSFSADLGLRFPKPSKALLWALAFLGLAVLEELVWSALGLPQPTRWGDRYNATTKLVRIAAMVVLAPVAEELAFRGILFHVISRTSLKEIGAIFLTAGLFAAAHLQYEIIPILFILINGILYGAVRYSTGSILLTMLLHGLGNAYAAYQRY